MKGMKKVGIRRLMAVLLAAVIMVSSVPAMKTDAAGGLAIKGKFTSWGTRDITKYGTTFQTYDCAVSWIGIDKSVYSRPTSFQYQVFTQDGTLRRQSKEIPYKGDGVKTGTDRDHKYYTVKVEGGRKTVLTSVRIRAKFGTKWSAWSGLIGLIPIHTPDYVKHSFNWSNRSLTINWSKFNGMSDYELYVSTSDKGPWKMVTRTTGTSYTLKSFNGSSLKKNTWYYYKVIGRAKVGNTMTKAKGDSASWYLDAAMYY